MKFECTSCETLHAPKDLFLCPESLQDAPCFECLCLPCINVHQGQHGALAPQQHGN